MINQSFYTVPDLNLYMGLWSAQNFHSTLTDFDNMSGSMVLDNETASTIISCILRKSSTNLSINSFAFELSLNLVLLNLVSLSYFYHILSYQQPYVHLRITDYLFYWFSFSQNGFKTIYNKVRIRKYPFFCQTYTLI